MAFSNRYEHHFFHSSLDKSLFLYFKFFLWAFLLSKPSGLQILPSNGSKSEEGNFKIFQGITSSILVPTSEEFGKASCSRGKWSKSIKKGSYSPFQNTKSLERYKKIFLHHSFINEWYIKVEALKTACIFECIEALWWLPLFKLKGPIQEDVVRVFYSNVFNKNYQTTPSWPLLTKFWSTSIRTL